MKVRCIDATNSFNRLTFNTIYEAELSKNNINHYHVKGVELCEWFKSRFEVVEENPSKENIVYNGIPIKLESNNNLGVVYVTSNDAIKNLTFSIGDPKQEIPKNNYNECCGGWGKHRLMCPKS